MPQQAFSKVAVAPYTQPLRRHIPPKQPQADEVRQYRLDYKDSRDPLQFEAADDDSARRRVAQKHDLRPNFSREAFEFVGCEKLVCLTYGEIVFPKPDVRH